MSARTVRYVHTILHGAFGAAVRDRRLTVNPADKAVPPSAKEATAPEMRAWDDVQLRRFLDWSKDSGDEMREAWSLLALTGMRRGEALALRWGDVDFDGATIAVRQAVTLVKTKGEGEQLVVGTPKSGKARVIDVDPQTLATLRDHRAELGTISLTLAREDDPVLGTIDGEIRHPERFSLAFKNRLAWARLKLGDYALPEIRLHKLRHTHATILLRAGVPVMISERLRPREPDDHADCVCARHAGDAARSRDEARRDGLRPLVVRRSISPVSRASLYPSYKARSPRNGGLRWCARGF